MVLAEAIAETNKLTGELYPEQLEHSLGDRPAGFGTDQPYLAALETNEVFEPVLAETVRRINPQYLVGIGFGNILTHTHCFQPDELKGIFAVDLSPKVVALCRATRQVLKECETAQEFVDVVRDRQALDKSLSNVDLGERTRYASDTLQKRIGCYRVHINGITEHERTQEEIENIIKGTAEPFHIKKTRDGELLRYPDTTAILLSNYQLFRKLALEGKLGVVESDIFDENTLNGIKKLKGYNNGTNVLYLSNLPNFRNVSAITKALQQPERTNVVSCGLDRHDIWAWSGNTPLYTMCIGYGSPPPLLRNMFKELNSGNQGIYHNVLRYNPGNGSTHERYYHGIKTKDDHGKHTQKELIPAPNDRWYQMINALLDHFDRQFGLPYQDVHIEFNWESKGENCGYCFPSPTSAKLAK